MGIVAGVCSLSPSWHWAYPSLKVLIYVVDVIVESVSSNQIQNRL